MAVRKYESVEEGVWGITSAQERVLFTGFNSNSRNILFYMDEENVSRIGERYVDTTCHLINHFSKSDDCSVCVSTSRIPELCEDAKYIFSRFDPPLDFSFSRELEKYDDGKRIFFNSPGAQQLISDKSYLKDFLEMGLVSDMYIGKDQGEIIDFIMRNKDVVMKPRFDSFGGNGIKRLVAKDYSEEGLVKKVSSLKDEVPFIFQKFIPEIFEYGDKRILLLNGEPIDCYTRFPGDGGFLSNLHQGGKDVASDLIDLDYSIIEKIKPWIEDNGMNLVGLDVIGPYLGEVNAISPGGIHTIDRLKYSFSEEKSSVNRIVKNILEGHHEN